MHWVDLGESFPTSIYLQNLASIPKHFLKLATSASQPASQPPSHPAISVFPAYFQISLNPNLQFSNSEFPNFFEKRSEKTENARSKRKHRKVRGTSGREEAQLNFPISRFPIVNLSHPLISLITLISYDPSRSEAIPPIPSDPSDPSDPFDPSRYL